MKRNFLLLAAVTASLMLTGCGDSEVQQSTETSETAETTTENPYLLVRSWEGWELLDSLFFCGEYHPLPFPEEELTFTEGTAEVQTDEDGNVTALRFNRLTAPRDFSIYGIGFDARPEDIPEVVGIANSIVGSDDGPLVYSFYGGGITELTFIFEQRQLSEVYIAL